MKTTSALIDKIKDQAWDYLRANFDLNAYGFAQFEYLWSPLGWDNYFCRFKKVDLETERQEWMILCFNKQGNQTDCNPIFTEEQKEEFFESLIPLKYERV